MRVLSALFLIVLAMVSPGTVFSFRGSIVPNKKGVLISSWMKSYPSNDADTSFHASCSSIYHLPKRVSRSTLSFARGRPLISDVHAYDRLQDRKYRSQRLSVISHVHIETDPQQMSKSADIMKAMELLDSVTSTAQELLFNSEGEFETPLQPFTPLKRLITLNPTLLVNSQEAKDEENEFKELAHRKMMQWVENDRLLKEELNEDTFATHNVTDDSSLRHMISPEILMSRIQPVLNGFNRRRVYSKQIYRLAFLHNDSEALQFIENTPSLVDPNDEKEAISNALSLDNEIQQADLDENDSKYFKEIATLNTSELIDKYKAEEDKLSKLVFMAMDNVNAMINIAKLSTRVKKIPDYEKVLNITEPRKDFEVDDLKPVTLEDLTRGGADKVTENIRTCILDQATFCEVATSPMVQRILTLKASQDGKGPSASISSLLRYATCLQYDTDCLLDKRDKLREEASWFMTASSASFSSFPVAATNDSEHVSFVPNSLQKELVVLEKYIDDKQEEILQIDHDVKRAVMLESLLPDGTDFLTSHSYFDSTAEIVEQPSLEERMAYITELYHHLMRVGERISMLRDIFAAHIIRTRVNLTASSLEYVPKYFEMDDGMEGLQREIKRLASAEEKMQAILQALLPVPKDLTPTDFINAKNESYTLAYVLDGVHKLRHMMDNILGKTRDSANTAQQSSDERKKMRNRRSIPDSASPQLRRAAFFEELRYALPGGMEEYFEDVQKLGKLARQTLTDTMKPTIPDVLKPF